jgi:hypothetical protein
MCCRFFEDFNLGQQIMGMKGYESAQGVPTKYPGCCPAPMTSNYSRRVSTRDLKDPKCPPNHLAIETLANVVYCNNSNLCNNNYY